MWEILGQLHDEGETILLTTHNMDEADQLCDRIGIMDHGKILALDTPQALKQSVGADTMVTISTDSEPDRLSAFLRDRVAGIQSSAVLEGRVRLGVRGSDGILLKVIAAADDGGFAITDATVTEPNLENVFINLTGKELRD
jgi:ABC-2 type transport system ATP-binding protein